MCHLTTPYEQIDCEIRPLVRLINRFPGLRTEFSCAGHAEGEDGYVSFRAESQENLARLVAALPRPLMVRVVDNQARYSALWVEAHLLNGVGLAYSLRFSGRPLWVQRELMGEIERALRGELDFLLQKVVASAL